MAKYVLDLTITCHSFCSVKPTLIAAASVYTARRICVEDKAWTAGLEHFSVYTERDLIGCVKEMLRMLIQAPEAKLQVIIIICYNVLYCKAGNYHYISQCVIL